MTFREDKTGDFLELFEVVKHEIRSFKGCKYLELLKDTDSESVFTSYSIWNSLECLENYRTSDLFQRTWKYTKSLFASPAVACSYKVFSKT
jgi:heme-degrading monooxygenase HmoA